MSAPAVSPSAAAARPLAVELLDELLAIDPASDAAATAKAELCLIDFLSCAFAGRRLPWALQAMAIAGRWPVANGAGVIGSRLAAAPAEAAFVNSVMAASASRTDIHPGSTAHPSAVVFPVVLALAAVQPVSGRDMIAAVVAGYEAIGRIGRVLVDDAFKRRFRATSVLGAVGGAVAAARLLRLDLAAATGALALSANTAAGLMEWGHSGEVDLFYQPAGAARSAVTAALLAAQGARGSATILDGPAGLFAAFGAADRAAAVRPSGNRRWEIDSVDFKPVPACIFVQAAAHAAVDLVQRHRPDPAAVSDIVVRTFEAALQYPGCDNPGPIDGIQAARMSLQHAVASVIGRGGLGDQNFVELDDAATRRLTGRISLASTAPFTAAFPARQGAEVEVRLDDGRVLAGQVDDVPPFAAEQVRQRFRRVAEPVLGAPRAAALEAACSGLGARADLRPLLALLAAED